MQQRIEDEMEGKKHIEERYVQHIEAKDEEMRKMRIELAKGDEEKAELRARLTEVCATHIPELKQQLTEKERVLEVLQADRDEIGSRATQLVTVYLPVRSQCRFGFR
jgi:chromosome segregation ATPase